MADVVTTQAAESDATVTTTDSASPATSGQPPMTSDPLAANAQGSEAAAASSTTADNAVLFNDSEAPVTAEIVEAGTTTASPATDDGTPPIHSTPYIVIGVLLVTLLVALVALIHKRGARDQSRGKAAAKSKTILCDPTVAIGNAQNIGSRDDQQDAFAISDVQNAKLMASKGLLAVVADGMGGLEDGSLISHTIVKTMHESFKSASAAMSDADMLLQLLKQAIQRVKEVQKDHSSSGSTVVAAVIHHQRLSFISVGDSRICLLRNGGLLQLNREHTFGRELDDMAANGALSAASAQANEQRKALTSYVGIPGSMDIDRNINPIELKQGDVIVLMSDGIYGMLSDAELTALLAQEPMTAANAIVQAIQSKANPHQDNMTVVILNIANETRGN